MDDLETEGKFLNTSARGIQLVKIRTSNGHDKQQQQQQQQHSPHVQQQHPFDEPGGGGERLVLEYEPEDEEERDSLLRETADHSALHSRQALRFRTAAAAIRMKQPAAPKDTTILGWVRSAGGSHRFLCHGVALMGVLAVLATLLPLVEWENHSMSLDDRPVDKEPPHQPSLGGGLNPGHYDTTSAGDAATFGISDAQHHEQFPKSNVGVAVLSATRMNRDNYRGHFWHDPYLSPYASHFYAQNRLSVVTKEQQDRFDRTRQHVMEQFGFFATVPFEPLRRPNFDNDLYRDKPGEEFPANAWQRNATYLKLWLDQAIGLVNRVKEGIYQEYGFDLSQAKSSNDQQQMQQARDEQFGILMNTDPKHPKYVIENGVAYDHYYRSRELPGIAYLTPTAWQGLVRKLLHAMMTHDDFYAVVVGRANTYRGNNFFESQIMQFHHIMEPVFDKLGVQLISRNMGMDASTTISALGGADIYGEADILWYVADPRSDETASTEMLGEMDLLHKQSILSGEHMPVILTPYQGDLLTDTNGKAWVGNLQAGGPGVCEKTRVRVSGSSVVLPNQEACKYLRCDAKAVKLGACNVYRSSCWINRTDWNPGEEDTTQNPNAGYQDQGYANYQEHIWEGRKLSMLVLKALEEALHQWSTQTEQGVLPLPDEMWHVKAVYEDLRESVRTLVRQPGKAAAIPCCERLLEKIDPMICHLSMHAYTEWTPRVNPIFKRIKNITDPGVADNHNGLVELYTNVELRPLEWQLPEGAVDVHMIAIATNSSVNEDKTFDETYYDDDGFGYGNDDDTYFPAGPAFGSSGDDGIGNRHRTRNLQLLQENLHRSMDLRPSSRLAADAAAANPWTIMNAPFGFCDGSAQSRCNRAIGNKCLMANYNHYKAGVLGRGDSGWLYLTLQNYKEGVILVRFDAFVKPFDSLPDDFMFDYSIDGTMFHMDKKEFVEAGVQLADDLVVHTLTIDKEMSRNVNRFEDKVRVGLRVQSASAPNFAEVFLTHIYYA